MGTKACKFCYQLNPPQTLVCEEHHHEAIASLTIQRDAAEALARENARACERATYLQADAVSRASNAAGAVNDANAERDEALAILRELAALDSDDIDVGRCRAMARARKLVGGEE